MADITPIILSGGSGTRLWPVSRTSYPKQLLSLAAETSMLQASLHRVPRQLGFAEPVVVAGEVQRFLVADQIDQLGLDQATILLEPHARNTAPATALAAHLVMAKDPAGLMLVMPSDHVVRDEIAFHAAVKAATDAARAGMLVTFGITPDRPETGYGYIHVGAALAPGMDDRVRTVERFVEKPDRTTAEQYLAAGTYLWNSGIFLFSARAYLDALAHLAPDIAASCEAAMRTVDVDGRFLRPHAEPLSACPDVSIDYAVMEKADHTVVVPVDMGWSDLGSWDALWDISARDDNGNAVHGDVIAVDSHNNLLRVERGPMLTVLGCEDLVVISTRDAILVAARDRAQDVKAIVDAVKAQGNDLHDIHAVAHRPWGTYETTDRGAGFQTKRIVVKPGQSLSLQMHHHRSEHWIVVSGTAKVTIDGAVQMLQQNQSTYIPAGAVHRLENPGQHPLHLIEVQCGTYLGEDDIVRFEDSYGRADKDKAETRHQRSTV